MGAGRPGIGPKEQASVPPEVSEWITKAQEQRGVRDRSQIVRELVLAGYEQKRTEA